MRVSKNFNLKYYNSYRLSAYCANAFFPENEEDLIHLYKERFDIPKIILGNGNNVILSKEWYENDFIIFNGCFDKVKISGSKIEAEAGATLKNLSEKALLHSLSGFEVFYDIPSSVGGAIVMNAGAGGEEIKDVLVGVRYLNLANLQKEELIKSDIGFSYRNSFFQMNKDKIVLNARFRLKKLDTQSIKNKMNSIKEMRWIKQPRDYSANVLSIRH